jgi:hypothetical protein
VEKVVPEDARDVFTGRQKESPDVLIGLPIYRGGEKEILD